MTPTQETHGKTMEEIAGEAYQQRNLRLSLLIDLEHDGVINGLIRTTYPDGNKSLNSYISQLQTGHRSFTETAARRIEFEFGKPVGWLDGSKDRAIEKAREASDLRVERLRAFISDNYGDTEAFFAQRGIGTRRQSLVNEVLAGTRFISQKKARAMEADFEIPTGYLDKE